MSRIVSIIVVVLALAGAGFLGFKLLGRNKTTSLIDSPPVASSSVVLPKGNTLNFDEVKKFNKDNRLFQYPQVTPGEIGNEVGQIIKQ